MRDGGRARVAIVDYGMGNLFSVKQACEHVGLRAEITSSPEPCLAADLLVLPGVGAFGDAMATLRRTGLADALLRLADAGKPIFGICLGMQLLMSRSHEFGHHEGLGLIEGQVLRLPDHMRTPTRRLKVPTVGWNRVMPARAEAYEGTPLEGLPAGEHMYFVHSYYARPNDPAVVVSTTRYGDVEYCSGIRRGNVFATQFHPERSGPRGLDVYRNLRRLSCPK